MRSPRVLSLAAALACTGCATNQSADREDDRDREQTVSLDQLPPAVKTTLIKEAGGGRIEEIAKETDDGCVVYEADVIFDGRKWEIAVGEDGQLLGKELDEENDGEDETDD